MSHGLDPCRFGRLTPREIVHALKGAVEGEWNNLRRAQAVAYSLAQLATTGVHQPRRMPSFDKAFPDRKAGAAQARAQTPDEALRNMEAWSAAWAAARKPKQGTGT